MKDDLKAKGCIYLLTTCRFVRRRLLAASWLGFRTTILCLVMATILWTPYMVKNEKQLLHWCVYCALLMAYSEHSESSLLTSSLSNDNIEQLCLL